MGFKYGPPRPDSFSSVKGHCDTCITLALWESKHTKPTSQKRMKRWLWGAFLGCQRWMGV